MYSDGKSAEHTYMYTHIEAHAHVQLAIEAVCILVAKLLHAVAAWLNPAELACIHKYIHTYIYTCAAGDRGFMYPDGKSAVRQSVANVPRTEVCCVHVCVLYECVRVRKCASVC
jgi:hypothetical protein